MKKSILLSSFSLAALVTLSAVTIPQWNNPMWGYDFHIFYQAAAALRSGQSPYAISGFYNPIYVMAYFVPLSFLPEKLAMIVNATITACAIWLVFYKLSQSPLTASLALCAHPVFAILLTGNVDWLALSAGVAIPVIGIWLAMIKPQIGIFLALMFGYQIFQQGKRRLVVLGSLLVMALAVSILLGMRWQGAIANQYNWSIFPFGIPIGLFLLWQGWQQKDRRVEALAAAPFFSPYLGIQSWSAVLLWLTRHRWILLTAVVVSWLV